MFSLFPNYEQASLVEQIKQVNELPRRNPEKFLHLLSEHIDLPTPMIPQTFYLAYHASKTNERQYPLASILPVVLLMHFYKFATASNFNTLLHLSPIVREFCRLPENNVPDDSVISKFKITFEHDLKLFFENLSLRVIHISSSYREFAHKATCDMQTT